MKDAHKPISILSSPFFFSRRKVKKKAMRNVVSVTDEEVTDEEVTDEEVTDEEVATFMDPETYLQAFQQTYDSESRQPNIRPEHSQQKGSKMYSVVVIARAEDRHLIEPILHWAYEIGSEHAAHFTSQHDTEHLNATKYTFWTDDVSHAHKVTDAFRQMCLTASLFEHSDDEQALLSGMEYQELVYKFTLDPNKPCIKNWKDVPPMQTKLS